MAQPGTASVRLRQVRDLARAEVRAMRLSPLAGSIAISALVVALALRHKVTDAGVLLGPLQIVAIVLGLGFAFVFDDPAADSISSAPTSLLFRRAVRLMPSILSVAAVWGVVLLLVAARTDGSIPIGIPTLYLVASLTFVIATASATGRATREGPGGIAGGPLLLLIVGLSRVLPARFRFFEATPGQGYSVGLRLGAVALLSAAVAFWASLDPGRRVRNLGALMRRQ
jgi:hypothetical protein